MTRFSLAGALLALTVTFAGVSMASDADTAQSEALGGGGRPVGEA